MKNNEIFKFFRFQNIEIIKYLLDYNDKLIKINILLFYQKFPGNKYPK